VQKLTRSIIAIGQMSRSPMAVIRVAAAVLRVAVLEAVPELVLALAMVLRKLSTAESLLECYQ
jgi:hypothetical protein